MILILSFVVLIILFFAYRKRSTPPVITINAPSDYAERLPDWIEIANVADQVWAKGKRISWLPPESYGDGACLLDGIIDLNGTDPALKRVIDESFAPTYFDGSCLAARMLVAAGSDECLMLGPMDDVVMQNKIASLCMETSANKSIYVQISSNSISPLTAKADREKFEQIWNQYA